MPSTPNTPEADELEKALEATRCIDPYCDSKGTTIDGNMENDPQPIQCQPCYVTRQALIAWSDARSKIAVIDARIDEIKETIVSQGSYGADHAYSREPFHVIDVSEARNRIATLEEQKRKLEEVL